MKIDTTTIDGYEEMTAEDKLKALENYEFQHDDTKLKNLLNKANSEAAKYKKELNARMTEEESRKAEQEEQITKMREKLEILENEKKVSEYEKNYLANGYPSDLAKETAQALADGNMELVFANNKKVISSIEQSMKEKALNAQSGLSSGNSPNAKAETEEEKLARALKKYANL